MSATTLKAFKILTRSSRLVLGHPKFSSIRAYNIKNEDLGSRYGGKANVTVLPGVGIGPEIMARTLEVLEAAQAPLSFEILTLPSEIDEQEFENIVTSIKRNKVALKGNIEVKSRNPAVKSRNVLLRKNLDLFVYVLRCKTFPNLQNKFGEFDVTVIRQNTEGEYLMLEHEPKPGTVENLKVVTRYSSERVAKFAFDYALKHNRKQIVVAHGSNIHKQCEGLFVEAAMEMSRQYPSIQFGLLDVSLAATKIIMNPAKFDIILASNLNGSMLSNILIGMTGGPGLTAGTNFGNDTAVFEPGARNKGSSIVGKGLASPVAMILAAVNLLEYLGYANTAGLLRKSLYNTLVRDKVRTNDLGGKATSKEITEKVIYHINNYLVPVRHRELPMALPWRKYCDLEDSSPKKK